MEFGTFIGIGLTLIVALVAVVVGILIGRSLAKAPDVAKLEGQILELQRRMDDWQRTMATQQQIERIQSDLANTQQVLGQVDRMLQNLSIFAQNNLQPQINRQLGDAISILNQVKQALQDAQQSLSDQSSSHEQRHIQIVSSLQSADSRLAELKTLLDEIDKSVRNGQSLLAGELRDAQTSISIVKEAVGRIENCLKAFPIVEDAIRRIEGDIGQLVATLLGRRVGQIGEQLVGELLSALPEDWLERDVVMGKGKVEFAIKMPGNYLVPLDSKFVAPKLVEQISQLLEGDGRDSDVEGRLREIEGEISAQVQSRAKEVARYLEDSRAFGFGIAAVPDAIYGLCRNAIKSAAERHHIVIVPYSLLLPFSLSLYLIAQRLGISAKLGDSEQAVATALRSLEAARKGMEKMAAELTAASNLRSGALDKINDAIRQLEKLAKGEITLPSEENAAK